MTGIVGIIKDYLISKGINDVFVNITQTHKSAL